MVAGPGFYTYQMTSSLPTARVAVIMRTFERPVLLARAIASVQNQTLVDGSTSRTPVEGVTINVLKADGTPIGEAVTGKDGLCTISVPSRDDYVIELNLATLPDGQTLIDAEKQKVSVNR